MNQFEFKTLTVANEEDIKTFEQAILNQSDDPMASMKSWSAPWRDESLKHYLPLGWSFGAWSKGSDDDGEFLGYFLAQPLVFHRQLTQTLWLEHLAGKSQKVEEALFDVAYRCAREKHLQSLSFDQSEKVSKLSEALSLPIQENSIGLIKTSKMREL